MLLAAHCDEDVEAMAASLGLRRFWKMTTRLAESVLFGDDSKRVPLQRWIVPTGLGIEHRRRSRLIGPFLVGSPIRVAGSHVSAYQLGRSVTRQGVRGNY